MQEKKVKLNKDDINLLIENARFLKKQDASQALEFLTNAITLSKESKYTSGIAQSLKEAGSIHFQNKNYKESLSSYQEAILNFEEMNETEEVYSCYNEISDIYFKIDDYGQALEAQLQALACSKRLHDKERTGSAYNKVGEIYKFHNEYRKAIEHHFNALKIFTELNDKRQLSATNFFIGNCYNWVNEYDISRNYLEKALALAEELGDPLLKVKPLGSLGILNTKLKAFDAALSFFKHAIENVDIIENKFLKSDLLKSLGKLYMELNDLDKADLTLHEALQISEELNVKFPANIIHQFLSELYEKKGDFEKSLHHFKIGSALNKEISNEEIALKTTGIQLKYDLDEIKKEKEVAEKSISLKDQFLANISHEIRTPLNGILGMAGLLNETRPTPEQLEYINTIKLSANNLLVIINDLFDYSKINTGKIKFDKQEFKIKELLTSLIQITKVKADEKKLQLSLFYDENAPDLLIGDPMRLNQILLNLLNNGVKFTEKGSVTLEMQLLAQKSNEVKLLFTVSDTGSGISEERIPKIFESFTNTHLHKSGSQSGTGLGLTIVKHLVELQGGAVHVNSNLNSGSIFKVELTFTVPEKFSLTKITPRKSAFHPKDLSLITLLLVEDNKVNQFLAKQLLTKMGFTVEIAGSGSRALEQLKKKNFDIILMDVQMPGMTGYELCAHIREKLQPPLNRIPIIALTAYASKQEKEKALSLGMNDYITKPYSPQELLAVILKHLNQQPAVSSSKDIAVPEKTNDEDMIGTLFSIMNNNKEDVISLIEMFLEQVPSINSSLENHIQQKNWDDAFQAAHKVKSSVKLLKINALTEVITQIEHDARARTKTDALPSLFENYKTICNGYIEKMRAELVKLKSGA